MRQTEFLVNTDVDDLEKAVLSYGTAFGLWVGRRFESSGVGMLGGSAPFYLLARAVEPVAIPAPGRRGGIPARGTPPRSRAPMKLSSNFDSRSLPAWRQPNGGRRRD